MQPTRPLRICFPFVGDTVGGSHVSIAALIAALPSDAVEPVVVLHEEGLLAPFLAQRNIGYLRAPPAAPVDNGSILSQFFAMARCAPRLATFLRRQAIDIVHTNDARMHLTWGPAARLAGCRFIWHQRSADDSRRNAIYARLAHEILTISQHCKRILPPPMAANARVIAEPFDTTAQLPDRNRARQAALEACGAPAEANIVGYVGNFTGQKRPLVFVEAAAILRQRHERPMFFLMIGEPRAPLAQEIESRIDTLDLRDTCRLLGPRHPIEPWIAGCDVLVAPAINEGLGRTLIEAMLVGTPVVAADDGGHRELVRDGETGVLARPDDPQAFADAIGCLLDDCGRARALAAAAGEFSRTHFSAERHAAEMQSIYHALVQ